MRLYHHPFSFNARRVVMAALELGAKVDLTFVDLGRGEQKKPEFLKMNPNGKVPVLDDDGFYVTESHAIMQYLADKTPGQTLYPQALQARTDVNRWLFWSAHQLSPSVSILGWERIVKPFLGLGAPEPALEKRGEDLVRECATTLDTHLAGRRWIAQDQLTLADLAIAAPFAVTVPAKLPTGGLKNLAAWLERIEALECWRATVPPPIGGEDRAREAPPRGAAALRA